MTGLVHAFAAVSGETWVDGGFAGDLFTFVIIAVILVAFCTTTALTMKRALSWMRHENWSQLAVACAMLVLFLVLFIGGWLVLDICWVFKAVGQRAGRVFAAAD
jgi:hypothetical protein